MKWMVLDVPEDPASMSRARDHLSPKNFYEYCFRKLTAKALWKKFTKERLHNPKKVHWTIFFMFFPVMERSFSYGGFHDTFAAIYRDQICGKKYWTKIFPGHVCEVSQYIQKESSLFSCPSDIVLFSHSNVINLSIEKREFLYFTFITRHKRS